MPSKHGGKRRTSGRKPAREKMVTIGIRITPAAAEYLDTLGTRMGIASAIVTWALGELGYNFNEAEAMRFGGIADRIEAKQRRERENVIAALKADE